MKYASLAGIGLMSMSLVACANETEKPVTLGDSMTQNGIQKIEDSPVADKCKEYELQKDGSYKCDNTDDSGGSGGSGVSSAMWFFNGMLFNSHNQMTSSSDYKANNLVSGTKTTTSSKSNPNGTKSNSSKSGTTSSSKSGGFGSGGRGSSGGS